MPRPKSILWNTRVAVFLAYRKLGRKVNPVANQFKIARSTVSAIKKEFEDLGFADGPRAKAPQEWLTQMQEAHLRDVVGRVASGNLGQFVSLGEMDIGPGTGAQGARDALARDPFPISEEMKWHLRGTHAEPVITDATKSRNAFLEREIKAWDDLQGALDQACGLPVREQPPTDGTSCLLQALVHRMRNACVADNLRGRAPTLDWNTHKDDPRGLRLNNEPVAVCGPDEREGVEQGVAAFVATKFPSFQRTFAELERLRRDMGFLKEIVRTEVAKVDEPLIRQGICPSCPYPEARDELQTKQTTGKRSETRRAKR